MPRIVELCDVKDVPDTPPDPVSDILGHRALRRPRQHYWTQQKRVLPDLAGALGAQVPPGVVLDGEAVIWNRDRLDFEALQQRMITSRAALPALVKELPAAFAAFDVLAVAGQDVRSVPFAGRRQLLEELAREWSAPLALSPTTTDPEVAKTWLKDLPAMGIEGLVVNSLLN